MDGYRAGCRKDCCRKANSERMAEYRANSPQKVEAARQRARTKRGKRGADRRAPVECGTARGVQRHRRMRTEFCAECQAFVVAKALVSRKVYKPCGTAAALRRHYRNGEGIDELCRTAFNISERARLG